MEEREKYQEYGTSYYEQFNLTLAIVSGRAKSIYFGATEFFNV